MTDFKHTQVSTCNERKAMLSLILRDLVWGGLSLEDAKEQILEELIEVSEGNWREGE